MFDPSIEREVSTVNVEEALQVADKSTNRNTPAREHPSLVNMIYALEILADGHRTYREKAVAWEETAGRLGRDLRAANEKLDRAQKRWSDLMDFVQTHDRSVDGTENMLRAVGRAFRDARLWARVKDMATGKFVAGDVVTADALNAVGEAVEAERGTGPGEARPKSRNLMGSGAMFEGPAVQEFSVGSPEPPERVVVVECHEMLTPLRFVRVAQTVNGDSLWRLLDQPSTTELWMWKDITEEPCREVLPQ